MDFLDSLLLVPLLTRHMSGLTKPGFPFIKTKECKYIYIYISYNVIGGQKMGKFHIVVQY